MGHSYLEANILGHRYLEAKNTGAPPLFRAKNILGHSYLEAKNTRPQESCESICTTLTKQMFARRTPLPKEHSLVLLTHLTYYLCGRPKINNSYNF